jgi:hypothetical protein
LVAEVRVAVGNGDVLPVIVVRTFLLVSGHTTKQWLRQSSKKR